ncbi:MAG TPA: glycosyltransferase family 4 protein [Mariniphaga sp.]|nr:glycosyltransferase family 4 protein [Mariniphaga sp.]
MRVLMFGWEFPPHISGGLGTACYGLTKGLVQNKEIKVLFVVPKAFGDEEQTDIDVIGANEIPIIKKDLEIINNQEKVNYIEVNSAIVPYIDEKQFWTLKKKIKNTQTRLVKTTHGYKIEFSGKYGLNLIEEIKNYAIVAEYIALENKFDLIHAHDWLAYPAGIAAKRISGKPLIIHVHATEFDRSGGDINPIAYSIERDGMENADKIIAVSNYTKQIIIEKYFIPAEKVITVYNGVEPVLNDKKYSFKKGLNEKVVTFLGRITMQKGPEYFIEAAYLILKKTKNVRFVMAGSGDKMNEMIDRVAQLGMADRFHFTGFLKGDEVTKMFKLTDVFVMPSVSEPFGIVPLEAIQADVPVIISNQSGVAEVLKNAIKIDFWDTYAMADSIFGLLKYPSMALHLKQTGKQEVKQLTWQHSAQKVYDVYKTVL